MSLSLIREGSGTRLRVWSSRFGGVAIEADILVAHPVGHETMNVVIPWSDRRFQFTSKQNCLPTTGAVRLRGGWIDGTGMTKNALCVDGRLTKLSEDVLFGYDPSDFARPWTIRTALSGRVDLVFRPFRERVAKSDFLVVRSEVHQLIGRYEGRITPDGGQAVSVDGPVGWAEEHRARR